MKYICRYLDDAEHIDAFDWKNGDTYVSPAVSGPKSEWERETLVDKNHFHVWSCVLQAISEVTTISSFPAAMDAVVCLEALSEMLYPEVPDPLDWEERTPGSRKPADMERNLVHARTVLRTPLALAISRLEQSGRELLQDTPTAQPHKEEPTDNLPGYLGLIVDRKNKIIRRKGHERDVDLRNKKALWDIFLLLLAAENHDVPDAVWRNGVSGEGSPSRANCGRLRIELLALGITVSRGGRQLVEDGEK
jgi:hypothetical protein